MPKPILDEADADILIAFASLASRLLTPTTSGLFALVKQYSLKGIQSETVNSYLLLMTLVIMPTIPYLS